MIRIEILGTPVAKGRPRLTTANGHARAYTPAKTQRYEDLIRLEAAKVMDGRPPLEGALCVILVALVPTPKALQTPPKQAQIDAGELHPITRPDLDNYIKVLDGLNGIVWRDDSQVVWLMSRKAYSNNPKLVITVDRLRADEMALAA